ncbi:hypothetical protein T484DRAFT_1879502, partial [Baffinella frigidus]
MSPFAPFVSAPRVWASAACMVLLVVFQCSLGWDDRRRAVSLEGEFSGSQQAMTASEAASHIKELLRDRATIKDQVADEMARITGHPSPHTHDAQGDSRGRLHARGAGSTGRDARHRAPPQGQIPARLRQAYAAVSGRKAEGSRVEPVEGGHVRRGSEARATADRTRLWSSKQRPEWKAFDPTKSLGEQEVETGLATARKVWAGLDCKKDWGEHPLLCIKEAYSGNLKGTKFQRPGSDPRHKDMGNSEESLNEERKEVAGKALRTRYDPPSLRYVKAARLRLARQKEMAARKAAAQGATTLAAEAHAAEAAEAAETARGKEVGEEQAKEAHTIQAAEAARGKEVDEEDKQAEQASRDAAALLAAAAAGGKLLKQT